MLRPWALLWLSPLAVCLFATVVYYVMLWYDDTRELCRVTTLHDDLQAKANKFVEVNATLTALNKAWRLSNATKQALMECKKDQAPLELAAEKNMGCPDNLEEVEGDTIKLSVQLQQCKGTTNGRAACESRMRSESGALAKLDGKLRACNDLAERPPNNELRDALHANKSCATKRTQLRNELAAQGTKLAELAKCNAMLKECRKEKDKMEQCRTTKEKLMADVALATSHLAIETHVQDESILLVKHSLETMTERLATCFTNFYAISEGLGKALDTCTHEEKVKTEHWLALEGRGTAAAIMFTPGGDEGAEVEFNPANEESVSGTLGKCMERAKTPTK